MGLDPGEELLLRHGVAGFEAFIGGFVAKAGHTLRNGGVLLLVPGAEEAMVKEDVGGDGACTSAEKCDCQDDRQRPLCPPGNQGGDDKARDAADGGKGEECPDRDGSEVHALTIPH